MPARFDLIITADHPSRTAELRLLDAHGTQLAFRQTDFKNISASHVQGQEQRHLASLERERRTGAIVSAIIHHNPISVVLSRLEVGAPAAFLGTNAGPKSEAESPYEPHS